MAGKITEGFREIIELRWSEFVAMETDRTGTNFEAIITSLVRACMKGNLRAIGVSLDRLDGKIATEIEVEYPKFYTLYPQATIAADDSSIIEIEATPDGNEKLYETMQGGAADLDELEAETEELPTGSLRAVLERMLSSPKQVATDLLSAAKEIDDGNAALGDPKVKSVIIAGLMKLVHDGRVSAVFEVLDQIDGKVADKFKVLGDDVYMVRYDTIAPAGAYKNEQGIYQLEANNITDSWVTRLEAKNNRRR